MKFTVYAYYGKFNDSKASYVILAPGCKVRRHLHDVAALPTCPSPGPGPKVNLKISGTLRNEDKVSESRLRRSRIRVGPKSSQGPQAASTPFGSSSLTWTEPGHAILVHVAPVAQLLPFARSAQPRAAPPQRHRHRPKTKKTYPPPPSHPMRSPTVIQRAARRSRP